MQIRRTTAALAGLAIAAGAAHAEVVPERPTYARDVAPILNENCAMCHRPGDIGPMSLLSYDEVRPWAKSIQKAVIEGAMPPWHADEGIGHFANERKLTKAQIATIAKWVDTGAQRGDLSDLPPAPELPDTEWRLGEPDVIVEFEKVDLAAGGPDQFYDLVGDPGLKEDKWINAIEVIAGNRKVLHHVIIWQGSDSGADRGWLGAWAAGMPPMKWKEGMGRLIKAGQPLIADMHFHPAETPESDQTRIGLHFADESEIEKEVINLWVQNATFEIPAGAENYGAKATYTFPQDAYILTLLPHMHYRGKDFTYTAHYPDGKREKLLKVSDYDFNWQTVYEYADPLFIPKGTRIECVAHWDNSTNNPANPDPTVNVRFGNESFNEMMIGFVDYIVKDGVRPIPPADAVGEKTKELASLHPGDVYTANLNAQDDGAMIFYPGVMHLPKTGGGGTWFVYVMGGLREAKLTGVSWDGASFQGAANVIGQNFTFKGAIDETGKLDGRLFAADLELAGEGEKIEGQRVN